jgi:hypothetical protein
MTRSLHIGIGLLLAMAVLANRAEAQINAPPPALMGQPSFHLYSIPGVMSSIGLETFFACTNTTSANIRVGVEIFGAGGGAAFNDPSATSLDIGPGGTRLFATSAAVGFSVDSSIGPVGTKGSARILATARSGIICSAFLADPFVAPPTTIADLTIVKKTKQQGD